MTFWELNHMLDEKEPINQIHYISVFNASPLAHLWNEDPPTMQSIPAPLPVVAGTDPNTLQAPIVELSFIACFKKNWTTLSKWKDNISIFSVFKTEYYLLNLKGLLASTQIYLYSICFNHDCLKAVYRNAEPDFRLQ